MSCLELDSLKLDKHKGIPELAPCKWAQKILHQQQLVTSERQFPNENVEVTL